MTPPPPGRSDPACASACPIKEGVSFVASIMTNASALTALQSLSATNRALEMTQARISTGYRVAEAADNAAYWSIATTMRSDNQALSTVQDALGLGASKVDTAYTAMNKAIDTVDEIKVKLVAAVGASPADKDKIQTEIAALQKQLKSYADSATFSGANWLSVNATVAGGQPVGRRPRRCADRLLLQSRRRRQRDARQDQHRRAGDQALRRRPPPRPRPSGILEGLRLGTTGVREDTAVRPAVAGTVAATRRLRRSRR